jgi:hypothetical protein
MEEGAAPSSRSFQKMAIKGNRSKKKLSTRAKPKKSVLKRRRVRTRKAQGK